MVKIAVIGAGINGLSCAVKIKEKYENLDVVLISNDFSPNTTGDGSGGLWYPYLCGKTSETILTKWGGETYRYLHKLWLEGGKHISLTPIYNLYTDKNNYYRPDWTKIVFGFQELQKKQLAYLNDLYSRDYTAGHSFTTFVVHPSTLLAYFYRRFKELNGKIVLASVTSLQDPVLDSYQVVINCTGLGAKYIVPDNNIFPIRGQVTRVLAPWINETIIDEDSGHYIIPNSVTCVLGGTHQEHDYNTKVDNFDTDFVMNGCTDMIPNLKSAKIVNHWAGLRPGRPEVRLEAEQRNGKLYIHNYGHGGSGFTLFWGCASEVLSKLETHLNNSNVNKSKL